MNQSFSIEPIGRVISPFKQKFGLPRQSNLIDHPCEIELIPPYNDPNALRGLKSFSHIWVVFVFDQHTQSEWRPTIRPPRLGGNEKIGVFASRSSFRPNHLAMSVVELKDVLIDGSKVRLRTSMLDAMDGTAIVDIKPYIDYSDCLPSTKSGYASEAPPQALNVELQAKAIQQIEAASGQYPGFETLIEQTLALDPRPAFKQDAADKRYRLALYDFDIEFYVNDGTAVVTQLFSNIVEKP